MVLHIASFVVKVIQIEVILANCIIGSGSHSRLNFENSITLMD